MWDWELLKKGSGQFHYQIIGQYGNEDFQYTHVISYGSEEDEFYLHNHSMYELVYCIRGDAVYQVDGVRYVVEPNSLLVINPTAPHRMFICSSSPLERHILYIYYAGNTSPLSSLIGKLPHNSDGKRFSSMYFSPQEVEKNRCFLSETKHGMPLKRQCYPRSCTIFCSIANSSVACNNVRAEA